MTDPMMADHIYLLPLTVESLEQILQERDIDAVLPTMGGQTALNLAIEAGKQGLWEKYEVRLIGVDLDAIERTENREAFRQLMLETGLSVAPSLEVLVEKAVLGWKEFELELLRDANDNVVIICTGILKNSRAPTTNWGCK